MSFKEVWTQIRTLIKDELVMQDVNHLNGADLSAIVIHGFSQEIQGDRGVAFSRVGSRMIDVNSNLQEVVVDFSVWGVNYEAIHDRLYDLLFPDLKNPFNDGINGAAQPSDRLITATQTS